MEKDRDQLTPDDPDDREYLDQHRGQGTAGTGQDRLPGEEAPANLEQGGEVAADDTRPAEGLES